MNFWAFTGKYAKAYWFSGFGNGFTSFSSAFQRTFFNISLKFILVPFGISRRRVLSSLTTLN
jgi:hypothetical protein